MMHSNFRFNMWRGRFSGALVFCVALWGCSGTSPPATRGAEPGPVTSAAAQSRAAKPFVLTVVGTNDLHGHVEALPVLLGHVDILRALRADDGAVLLVDAGDMFQGTLVANHTEGAAVVRGYNVSGYRGAAIGNHEFDYGPVGPLSTPESEVDNPRGALLLRAQEAEFPFLAANLLDKNTGRLVHWEGVVPDTRVDFGAVSVGLIGVTTEETLSTTLAGNVSDLAIAPLAETIAMRARRLRQEGADVVVVLAHAGARCDAFFDPDDVSSCDGDEVFRVAEALPEGLVDVIVGGHTHRGVAHRVNGVAVIESFAYGRAFGRVDLLIDNSDAAPPRGEIHPPRFLCPDHNTGTADCVPEPYEGRQVVPNAAVLNAIAADMEAAERIRQRPLGVSVASPMEHVRVRETPLSNWMADQVRVGKSGDVGLINGGGIRTSLGAGPLTYGELYELYPFDNRFAKVQMTGAELAELIAENLQSDRGFQSLSGVRGEARCERGEVRVELRLESGMRVHPRRRLNVVMSDYLATSASPVLTRVREEGRVRIEDDLVREQIADQLEAQSGLVIDPRAARLAPGRIRHSGRPMVCPEPGER